MKKIKRGFTLSEVIITLVVIGIVAAITVPMLSNSASDKKWNVARQKAQATIGEAFRLMTVNGEIDKSLSTQQFVEKVIPKYLKINKTCTIAKATECGMSTASNFYKTPDGTKVTLPTTWQTSTTASIVSPTDSNSRITYNHTSPDTNNSFMFQTLDGFSVNFFYNPYCSSANGADRRYKNAVYHVLDLNCFNAVYDMNGKAGPNKVGLDVGFIGSFNNNYDAKSASVLPYGKTVMFNSIKKANTYFSRQTANYCSNLDKEGTWKLPSMEEAGLLYLNLKLLRNSIATNQLNCFNFQNSSPTDSDYYKNWLNAWAHTTQTTNWTGGAMVGYDSQNMHKVSILCVHANALK